MAVLPAACAALAAASVFQFYGYYILTDHGWSPGRLATMVILAGAVGVELRRHRGREPVLAHHLAHRRAGPDPGQGFAIAR